LDSIGVSQYKILACDKSADQLSLLRDRIKRGEISQKVLPLEIDFDNTSLPLEPDSVDLTYMAWVLHHLTNQTAVLKKIALATRKGARIFMYQVTIEDLENHQLNEYFPMKYEYDKKRYPTLPQLKQMFSNAGFTFETPHVIKKDDPRVFNRALLESVADTTLDSALKMIKDNDPVAFREGLHKLELEVKRCELSGKYRPYAHVDRSIFWGIKE
jgi:SAM-dependent methyltransferase